MSSKVFKRSLSTSILSDQEIKNIRGSNTTTNSSNKEMAFIARNLVEPQNTALNQRTSRDGTPIPDEQDISRLLKVAATSTRDARNILKSSPELCMGIDIYIAGLLSPNDVSRPELAILSTSNIELQPIKSKLLDVVRTWAKDEYKIDNRLKNWVFKAKYLAGAVPLAIVPMTEIDDIVNETDLNKKRLSLESYDSSNNGRFNKGYYNSTGVLGAGLNQPEKKKDKGVLGLLNMAQESGDNQPLYFDNQITLSDTQKTNIHKNCSAEVEVSGKKEKVSNVILEALNKIYIHDNIEAFKIPRLKLASARRQVQRRFSPLYKHNQAMESGDGRNTTDQPTIMVDQNGNFKYPNRSYSTREIINVRPKDMYENFGHPLVIELPYESALPICPPGLPEEPVGFIVVLDSSFNPLTITEEDLNLADPTDISVQSSAGVMGTQMLSQLGDASPEGLMNFRNGVMTEANNRLFTNILEADLRERLRNGIYSNMEFDVKLLPVFAEFMFKRALAGMETQFLFIPNELLTYIAFETNEWGLGESKLSKHKGLAIIASTVQVANALASITNAIPHKKATIGFDDDEIDAFDTSEKLEQHIVRSQWANSLFSSSNTQDQLNHVLNSGFHFVYENGNGNFPNTSYDIEYINRDVATIDNDYLDSVNRRLIMLSGVSPEIVDMSQEVEFAQTYITGHMLRAQQAAIEQEIFCAGLSKFVRSFVLHSAIIIDELRGIVEAALKATDSPLKGIKTPVEDLIEEFINSIETSLPKPDTTKLDMQMKNITTHEEFIDKVIEYHFSDPMFASEEVGEKGADKIELVKAVWKSSYIRGIMQSNNLIPSQFNLLHGVETEEGIVDPLEESEGMVKRYLEYIVQHEKQMAGVRYKTDATIERVQETAQAAAGETDGGSDTNEPATDPEPNGDDSNPDQGEGEAPAEGEGEDLFGMGDDDTASPIE